MIIMTQNQKKNLQVKWRRAACAFLLYACLPLAGGVVGGLLLLINSVGAAEAKAVLQEYGDLSLRVAVGAFQSRDDKAGASYYALSDELLLPMADTEKTLVGAGRYYAPIQTDASEAIAVTPAIRYESLPAGATKVVRSDLSAVSYFLNSTKYSVDLDAARAAAFPSKTSSENGEPLVLVLHTHATEAYLEDNTNLSDFAPEGVDTYFLQGETSFRTTDPTKSVVQVGKVFCETLEGLGVPTLHCTIQHDAEDFNTAYDRSAETVKALLAEHPSIQYVIDLHRDSVVRGEDYIKSFYEYDSKSAAQVMLVVGTNQYGRHPNWLQNLTVAVAFRDSMDARHPGFSRSVYLRTARFNQEFLPGCMLLEVGCAANTLAEAENAARLAAEDFAAMLASR